MKGTALRILFAALLVFGCREEKPPEYATVAPTKTEEKVEVPAVRLPRGVAAVRIDFHNAISHVFHPDLNKGHALLKGRALFLKDGHHKAMLTIMFPTEAEKEALKGKFGEIGVNVDCKLGNRCFVPLNGLRLTLVRGRRDQPLEPTFKPTEEFKNVVPHLKTVGDLDSLKDDATHRFPQGNFTAFFDFNGGTLSATRCDSELTLKKKGFALTPIPAAEMVTLVATTPGPPRLKFTTDDKTWRWIDFKESGLIWLIFDNKPNNEKEPHFHLHKNVGNVKAGGEYPTVKDAPKCSPFRGVTAACGNTQWP